MATDKTDRHPPLHPLSWREDGRVLLLLAGLVLLVFGYTVFFDSLIMDDQRFVFQNKEIMKGLAGGGLRVLFTHFWMPLTTLTHLVDASLFGKNPAGHHAHSVLWHLGAVLLWYLALVRMTGNRGAAALAAALFAVHPLRAEAVAWIASRKEVVSGFWFAGTVLLYARYAARPSVGRMALVCLGMALAVLSKQTVLTLPCALLLLDLWPLGRLTLLRPATWVRPVLEKLPLFALCVPAMLLARATQREFGALEWAAELPLSFRAGNAVVSLARYLGHTVWPVPLMGHYPELRNTLTPGMVAGAAALLLVVTAAVLFLALRRNPMLYPLTGWAWFLGTLAPVLGLVGFGNASMADRWAYIPHLGLMAAVAWGWLALADRLAPAPEAPPESRPPKKAPHRKTAKAAPQNRLALRGAVVLVAVTALLGIRQTSYWWNDQVLCTRMLAVSDGANALAHTNLGYLCGRAKDPAGAMEHYRKASELEPHNPFWAVNYAMALNGAERAPEAEALLAPFLATDGDNPHVRMQLGISLFNQKRFAEALPHMEAAVKRLPKNHLYLTNWGHCLGNLGRTDEARKAYQAALAVEPRYKGARAALEALGAP
ncbi:MAG: tetratricopeptide repeat protein [Candidatus Hydrogenedentes bacterium]|nr:tetratricopeptide repeat protein [Candidatus Hydrogenedentota bacterium]